MYSQVDPYATGAILPALAKRRERGAHWPDALIDGAIDPETLQPGITVAVSGERLYFFRLRGLPGYQDAKLIPDTVRAPDSIWETIDGDFLYYRIISNLANPRTLFFARVRRTGWRCFVWDFEDPSAYNASIPKSCGADRMKRRVK